MDDDILDLGDGAWVRYVPRWLPEHRELMDEILRTIELEHGVRRGRPSKRLVRHIGLTYYFDAGHLSVLPWEPPWSDLRDRLERELDAMFNECLVSYYRDGADDLTPHEDPYTMPGSVIASVSLGVPRKFILQHPRHGLRSWQLGNGDLFVLGGSTLERPWQHGIDGAKRAVGPRMSLTFRLLVTK